MASDTTALQQDWFSSPDDGITSLAWSDCQATHTDSRPVERDAEASQGDMFANTVDEVPAVDMGSMEPSQSIVEDSADSKAADIETLTVTTDTADGSVVMESRLSTAGSKRRRPHSGSGDASDDVVTPAKLAGSAQALSPTDDLSAHATRSRVRAAGKGSTAAPPGAVDHRSSCSPVSGHAPDAEPGGGRVKTVPTLVTSKPRSNVD
jgi:hypothetical protein